MHSVGSVPHFCWLSAPPPSPLRLPPPPSPLRLPPQTTPGTWLNMWTTWGHLSGTSPDSKVHRANTSPSGAYRTQVGPMADPHWTLLPGCVYIVFQVQPMLFKLAFTGNQLVAQLNDLLHLRSTFCEFFGVSHLFGWKHCSFCRNTVYVRN